MSPNEYHENLGARIFLFQGVLHIVKVVGATRHM